MTQAHVHVGLASRDAFWRASALRPPATPISLLPGCAASGVSTRRWRTTRLHGGISGLPSARVRKHGRPQRGRGAWVVAFLGCRSLGCYRVWPGSDDVARCSLNPPFWSSPLSLSSRARVYILWNAVSSPPRRDCMHNPGARGAMIAVSRRALAPPERKRMVLRST